MPKKQLQTYVILFRDEWNIPEPAYYWLDEVKGKNPNDAIERNRAHLLARVHKILSLRRGEVAEHKLEREFYALPAESWFSAREKYWQVQTI